MTGAASVFGACLSELRSGMGMYEGAKVLVMRRISLQGA